MKKKHNTLTDIFKGDVKLWRSAQRQCHIDIDFTNHKDMYSRVSMESMVGNEFLSQRNADIVKDRLFGEDTYVVIAKRYNVSAARVRQIYLEVMRSIFGEVTYNYCKENISKLQNI